MSSSTAASNTARTRNVRCETADKQQVLVGLDILRLSHTFTEMYGNLGIEEHEEFPGVFPVTSVDLRVFVRVIDWCTEHKGQADPLVEKDAFTQEEKWFEFSDFERCFLSVPVPELLELIQAADFLDIRGLYEYGCQAIAALIKGKSPFEVREILQQAGDLTAENIDEIFARNPWLGLGSRAEFQDHLVAIPAPIYTPAEVLVTVFQKLPRADLERFQLVSRYFRDVIVNSSEHELSEKRGPLRPVNVDLGVKHFVRSVDSDSSAVCPDRDSLGKRLKFCTVRAIDWDGNSEMSCELLAPLGPLKPAWKNATVYLPLDSFPSRASYELAFTEVFMRKEIDLWGQDCFDPQPFMRLPAIQHCNNLHIRYVSHALAVNDVVEWVERKKPKRWDEPTCLEIRSYEVIGGVAALVDALKKTFLEAARSNSYTVLIKPLGDNPRYDEEHHNETTKERLTIKSAKDDKAWGRWRISMERK